MGFLYFGRYFPTSSLTVNRPSSISIMIATEVIGLVIDAMLKIVSLAMGRLPSVRLRPKASWYKTPSLLTTATTIPGTSDRSVALLRKVDRAAVPLGVMDGTLGTSVRSSSGQ